MKKNNNRQISVLEKEIKQLEYIESKLDILIQLYKVRGAHKTSKIDMATDWINTLQNLGEIARVGGNQLYFGSVENRIKWLLRRKKELEEKITKKEKILAELIHKKTILEQYIPYMWGVSGMFTNADIMKQLNR
jgi:hypothetical protein